MHWPRRRNRNIRSGWSRQNSHNPYTAFSFLRATGRRTRGFHTMGLWDSIWRSIGKRCRSRVLLRVRGRGETEATPARDPKVANGSLSPWTSWDRWDKKTLKSGKNSRRSPNSCPFSSTSNFGRIDTPTSPAKRKPWFLTWLWSMLKKKKKLRGKNMRYCKVRPRS